MELKPKHYLLEWPENTLENVRKLYNIEKPERLKETLDLLDDWIQMQPHFLKKDFSRAYLEKKIVSCKGSMEKAKKQLDRLCTMKTVLPKFFKKTNIKEELKYMTEWVQVYPLPKMAGDYNRVIFVTFTEKEYQAHHFLELYQYNIILSEYIMRHDYLNGFIFVLDFRNLNIIEMAMKLNPVELQEFATLLTECYGARLRNIYLISDSKAIDLIVNITKQFLSLKLNSRVHVVPNIEALYDFMPRKILPSDHGGMEKSSDTLSKEWVEALSSDEHVQYMKIMNKACTDEALRQTGKFNEDYMGMPGSFRNLSVD